MAIRGESKPHRPTRTSARWPGSGYIHEIDEPASSDLRDLASYWSGLAARHGGCPGRPDLDLKAVKRHLPKLFLLESIEDGADFRYRVVGTAIVEKFGRDCTGKCWSEIDYMTQAQALRRTWQIALGRPVPTFFAGEAAWRPELAPLGFEAVLLPLFEHRRPQMLLGALDWG